MSEPTSFSIYLDTPDDGAYHVKNGPGEVQRQHIVDRGSALVVLADLTAVVHGTLAPSADPATLIITTFQFLPTKASRRFLAATITMRFCSCSSSPDPIVYRIAPLGHFSLTPTKHQIDLTRSADLSAHAGVPGTANFGTTLRWEHKQSSEFKAQTTISGAIRLEGRKYGQKNTARWSLLENPVQKSGIPTTVRTAVLLKRMTADDRFKAEVDVQAEVDLASKLDGAIDKVFGKVESDDAVVFDPGKKGSVESVDGERLGQTDLMALSAVSKTTFLADEM